MSEVRQQRVETPDSTARRRVWFGLVLLLVPILASFPRFGHRENEPMVLSDSDYYLDMAEYFTGESDAFNGTFIRAGAHHYNRPALPFLAGKLGGALDNNFRFAFSALNILAALAIAWLLYRLVLNSGLAPRFAWTVPVFFLISFPQMNWGYHILTDTFGFATAFFASVYAVSILDRSLEETPFARRAGQLTLLLVLSIVAFLTRETGWFILVIVGVWAVLRARSRTQWLIVVLVGAAVVVGKIPHSFYESAWDLHSVSLRFHLAEIFDPKYILDFLVKTGVAFNLLWIPVALLLFRRDLPRVPTFFWMWSVAAFLYMGAGYIHNRQGFIGYPLRLSFALFPLVLLLCAYWLERSVTSPKATRIGVLAVIITYVVNLTGVVLDNEQGRIRVWDIIEQIKIIG